MSTRKCAERAAIDLVVVKAFDLLVLHSSAKTSLKLKRLMDENGGYGIHELTRQLDSEIQRRVMDSEVQTHNLLEVYVALSRASHLFREITSVCDKLSVFIKMRSDLIDTLVRVLSQVEQHVIRSSSLDGFKAFSDEYISIEDDNDGDRWFEWMPHPRLENQEFCVSSDLATTLFSIFDSKEKFLEQYQKELAARLISNGWSESIQFEVLEILRKVFSDREMESCQVMLWDIRNSEKLLTCDGGNSDFVSKLPFAIQLKILSLEYWPDSFINFSEKVNDFRTIDRWIGPVLKDVGRYFERISMSKRYLNWSALEDSSNTANIELEICDARNGESLLTAQYEVSLIDAMIIMLFLEKEKWTFDELNSTTGLETPLLRQTIHRWIVKGVLSYNDFQRNVLVIELIRPSVNKLNTA